MKRRIETHRLVLMVLDESYAPQVLEFYNRNQAFLEPWEPERNAFFYTLKNQLMTLRLEREAFERDEMVRYWLFSKQDKNLSLPIGSIALTNIVKGVFKSCFIGYKMDQSFEGRGYMAEAISAVIKVAFEDIGLHRIEANIMPRNTKSLRVVEKNGFVSEGVSRKYLLIKGTWEDHVHMVLLNESLEK